MHTQDFALDDGRPVTIEFTYKPGSDTTYSPAYGACGGDAPEVEIIHCWPRNTAYEELARRWNDLHWGADANRCFSWAAIKIVQIRMWWAERSVRLSDREYERMEAWLLENHVYDPYDPEDYF